MQHTFIKMLYTKVCDQLVAMLIATVQVMEKGLKKNLENKLDSPPTVCLTFKRKCLNND